MTDLEITRLCAEAMGNEYKGAKISPPNDTWLPKGKYHYPSGGNILQVYDPLTNDEQAMALVKRFGLMIEADGVPATEWVVAYWNHPLVKWERIASPNLNRAICECVANMQANRSDK